jgi:hypothetical protein
MLQKHMLKFISETCLIAETQKFSAIETRKTFSPEVPSLPTPGRGSSCGARKSLPHTFQQKHR